MLSLLLSRSARGRVYVTMNIKVSGMHNGNWAVFGSELCELNGARGPEARQ